MSEQITATGPERQRATFLLDKAFASYSINELDAAKRFYGETLGLKVTEEEGCGLGLHFPGGASVFLYPKADHQPANFTVLNLPVKDIDAAVAALGDKGIRFEQYGGDIATDEQGILRTPPDQPGPAAIAWFKDPAGNILSVLQET